MPTQAGIVNRGLQLVGQQVQVTGTNPAFDGSVAGNAAGVLYTPAVEMLLRQLDPDFARKIAALTAQTSATLLGLTSWTREFAYPSDCLRLRQVRPLPGNYDPLDPQPVRAQVAFDPLSAGGPARVILCNLQTADAVYTTANVTEALFDAAFAEAVARRISSPMAMALAGRPDFARELLEESMQFASMSEMSEEL